MNLIQLLDRFKHDEAIRRNITCWKEIPAKEAVYSDMPEGLDPRLIQALAKKGVHQLYSHQESAIKAILNGEDIVVVTPTASGKTMCYNLPVVNAILKDASSRAMLLFPTKALSYDQVKELDDLISGTGASIKAYTYDGDTPQSARKAIRQAGSIVVTNPDMLHGAILPNHMKWTRLFESLKYIVIDELHHYGGVFGCHLANVLRRLLRICKFYGSNPQFICCSATIANPGELAMRITGRQVRIIDNNGSPSGEKHIVFYNPPLVNRDLGIRKGSVLETRQLAETLLKNDVSTIVFTRSRLNVEVLTTYLKEGLKGGKGTDKRIRGYRGGYLPNLRREIEKGLRDGSVLGVVSTNALELGIDIGSLEACVICGYPGTIASMWQQAGRAGRRHGASAVFLVATSGPLDQYIVNNPEYFFGSSPEHGLVNPDNFVILYSHLKCAAYELPFSDGENFGGSAVDEMLDYMEEARLLRHVNGRYYWMTDVFPAEGISLRSAANENFIIIDITLPGERAVIGEVDRFSAPMLLHEEAIYIHDARQYQVEKLDFDDKKAYVRRVDVDYYTDANLTVDLAVLDVFRQSSFGGTACGGTACGGTVGGGMASGGAASGGMVSGGMASGGAADGMLGGTVGAKPGGGTVGNGTSVNVRKNCGDVKVTALVSLFKKIKLNTHENIGSGPVNLPELEMHTTSYWVELPESLNLAADNKTAFEAARIQDAMIGLTNVLSHAAPVYLMCGRGDIRVVHQTKSPFTKKPTIFIYDNYPGGVGFSDKLYDLHDEVFTMALKLIRNCQCETGCPSCVGPQDEFSGRGNPKRDTTGLIEFILGIRGEPLL